MALVKDNPLIPAAADVKVFAISLTNADSLLKLGGATGLPFNNAAAQLIGTTIAAGVTPLTNIARLDVAQNFNGQQTAFRGNGYGWISLSQNAAVYSGIGVGRLTVDGAVVAVGAAGTAFPGTAPGDITVIGLGAANIWLGTTGSPGALKLLANGDTTVLGNLKFAAGKGIFVKEGGADARMGTVVLNGVTPVVINTTAVTANSRIFFSCQSSPGTIGIPLIAARVAGVSFSLRSSLAGDLSTYAWEIREPAP